MIVSAFKGLREQGIEPVLIKGWAAARNYPADVPRFSGDIDLAVADEDFDCARSLVEDKKSGVLGVDLHQQLRHLDTVDWKILLENSETIAVDGEAIRILAAEDHLRVMCVHWLTDGGESRDRLWDIFYAVQNRPESFDWDRCLGVVGPNRRGWIIATVGLAHKYLGLEIDDLPFADEARRLPTWLTRSIERSWNEGVRLRPLHTALDDMRTLLTQIRKRIPPNPIQATIDCEGAFDDGSRVGYQIRDVFIRLWPSIPRVVPALLKR